MKAEELLAETFEKRTSLTKAEAAKAARRLAEQQVVRSICEDGRPINRMETSHGRANHR